MGSLNTVVARFAPGVVALVNKVFDLADNTLTGTLAQFNTALSDGDFASRDGVETLTHKTLTSPALTTPTVSSPVITGTVTGAGVDTTAAASTLAKRDVNANLAADNFLAGCDSTVSAAGTTTLSINSAFHQLVTGSTTHTLALPTTSVPLGHAHLIDNQSTGNLTVNASGGANITTVIGGAAALVVAIAATPTTAAHWFFFRMYPSTSSATTASTAVIRDGNQNILANNWLSNSTSVTTSAGTNTLGVGSVRVWIYTGSTTHNCKLPTTSVIVGHAHVIINLSSGAVTVQSSGGETVATLTTGQSVTPMANTATPTTAAHWTIVSKNY